MFARGYIDLKDIPASGAITNRRQPQPAGVDGSRDRAILAISPPSATCTITLAVNGNGIISASPAAGAAVATTSSPVGTGSKASGLLRFCKNFRPISGIKHKSAHHQFHYRRRPVKCLFRQRFPDRSQLVNFRYHKSAGRQLIASAPFKTRACNWVFTGAGVAPYSPFKTPAVSLEIDL